MQEESNKIYIILSYTGTLLSKLIKVYSKASYAHVSIALDKDLNQMYSFGRLCSYNPFIGGFVHENINFGTFKRFKKTQVRVYSIEVTNEQYAKLNALINVFINNPNDYNFNVLGLFLAGFNYKREKKNYFYCAEFVKYVINSSKLNLDLPSIVKPIDFAKVDGLTLEYEGLFKQYFSVCLSDYHK